MSDNRTDLPSPNAPNFNQRVKTCSKCKITRPTSEFVKKSTAKDGMHSNCKVCTHATLAAYRLKNAEKIKAYRDTHKDMARSASAEWSSKNKDRKKATNAKYRKSNRDKIKANKARWYAENRERLLAESVEWKKANPERVKAIQARYNAKRPELRRIINQNRRAKVLQCGGRLSVDLAEKLLLLQKGRCAFCRLPLGADYHLDHIMPLALGGSNKDSNMQLLHKHCNQKKSSTHPVDFMQKQGFLL